MKIHNILGIKFNGKYSGIDYNSVMGCYVAGAPLGFLKCVLHIWSLCT